MQIKIMQIKIMRNELGKSKAACSSQFHYNCWFRLAYASRQTQPMFITGTLAMQFKLDHMCGLRTQNEANWAEPTYFCWQIWIKKCLQTTSGGGLF